MNSGALRASKREARQADAEHDRVLIQRAQAGDRSAFRELVQRHQRRAHTVAYALVRDEQDAREVVQEAFLRVHRNLDTFNGSSAFFTWFYRIVSNLAIDLIRRPARRDAAPLDDAELEQAADSPLLARVDDSNPLQAAQRAQLRARLAAALDALPPYHRGVIVMREIDGMSYDEMAEAMGVSKGTIMSRLFHARQKMQRALAECYREQVGRAPPTPAMRPKAGSPASEGES